MGFFFTAVVDNGELKQGGVDVIDFPPALNLRFQEFSLLLELLLYWNFIVFKFLMTGHSIYS